jgi:hypothetical protein
VARSRFSRDRRRNLARFRCVSRLTACLRDFAADDRSRRGAPRRPTRTGGTDEAKLLLHRGRGHSRHRFSVAAEVHGNARHGRGMAIRPWGRGQGRRDRHRCFSAPQVPAPDPWWRLRHGRRRWIIGLRCARHHRGVGYRRSAGERRRTASCGTAQADHHSDY